VATEQAVLDVRPGAEAEFEATFAEATKIISSMMSFLSLGLHRCIERG
jgi:heme-degrading monooxygenase HmoA